MKYAFVENTVEFRCSSYLIRLWIKTDRLPSHRMVDFSVYDQLKQIEMEYKPKINKMIGDYPLPIAPFNYVVTNAIEILEDIEDVTAIQVIWDYDNLGNGPRLGTVVYLTPFSEGENDVHG